jgi:hypothetical protein
MLGVSATYDTSGKIILIRLNMADARRPALRA